MRHIVVLDVHNFLARETVLANAMLSLLREEAAFVTEAALFGASFYIRVPKHSQRACARRVECYRK